MRVLVVPNPQKIQETKVVTRHPVLNGIHEKV